ESLGGRLTVGVDAEAKRTEQLSIARRSLTERMRRIATGQALLPKTPYGMLREIAPDGRAKLIPHTRHAAVVRQIFAWAAAGMTTGQICQRLADQYTLSPTGQLRWRRCTIASLVANRAYIGDVEHGKSTRGRFLRATPDGKIEELPSTQRDG